MNQEHRTEVIRYLERDALKMKGNPLSACMVYCNYGNVWEICALYTVESARRKGYARMVVEAALHRLVVNGHLPRYQMEEGNSASKALAEQIGLKRFLVTEHYLSALSHLSQRSTSKA